MLLLETITWADGNTTQSVVEDHGQGAVDCPSDDISSKKYHQISTAEEQFWYCGHCGKYEVFFDVCRSCYAAYVEEAPSNKGPLDPEGEDMLSKKWQEYYGRNNCHNCLADIEGNPICPDCGWDADEDECEVCTESGRGCNCDCNPDGSCPACGGTGKKE